MKNYTHDSRDINHNWSDGSGAYTVSASLANGQKHRWDLSEIYPDDTVAISIEIEITSDGSLELWYTKSACDE